jgi:hypothetical protein
MMNALGQAGSDYRWNYYSQGLSGKVTQLAISDLIAFLDLAQQFVEHSLHANKRSDNLYHAYNILHLGDKTSSIRHLNEMLEGQVSILSSGLLSGEKSLALLESLRHSQLYRPDQHSYILYPDRKLPGFLEKNCMTSNQISDLPLVSELVNSQDKTLIVRDEEGFYHFSGNIHNSKDVTRSLNALKKQSEYAELANSDAAKIEALFEDTFQHSEFTGRSGTFFAYEGLGSIYWHMVSKLLLAVQETIMRTRSEPSTPALIGKYTDIRNGFSFNKAPDIYGAFPTDPYSHTPKGQGAKQPGMTGLVKEEILTRQAELGFFIENGDLVFDFLMLDKNEFLSDPRKFSYFGVDGHPQQIELNAGSLAYSICQIPVILQASHENRITVHFTSGGTQQIESHVLDSFNSRHIFQRDGVIHHLIVSIASRK